MSMFAPVSPRITAMSFFETIVAGYNIKLNYEFNRKRNQ